MEEERSPAERLRDFRLSQQESLSAFAAKLGISKGWLSLVERGISPPGSIRLGRVIEQITGIRADEWPVNERKPRKPNAA